MATRPWWISFSCRDFGSFNHASTLRGGHRALKFLAVSGEDGNLSAAGELLFEVSAGVGRDLRQIRLNALEPAEHLPMLESWKSTGVGKYCASP
jgi:hypothetical protein